MADGEPTRNGYHRIDNVQEPEDRTGKTRTYAWLSVAELKNVFKHSPWKAQNFRSADAVLKNPDRVFKHIRVGDETSGWCYSKLLSTTFTADGRPTPARENTVFTVYMNSDCSVFEWGADESDPDDPKSPSGAPEGIGTELGRFGELVWRRA